MGDGGLSRPRASTFQLIFVTWFLFGIAFLIFVSRIAVRFKTSKRLFLDDAFALLAILCLCANGVIVTIMLPTMYITIRMAKMGSKREAPPFDAFASLTFFLKMQFAQSFIYWTCLWAVKASFLAFFKRLTTNLKGHIIAWWTIVAITVLGYAGSVISYPVSCASFQPCKTLPPMRQEFSLTFVTTVGCTSQKNATLSLVSLRFSTAADILTDLLIIALPMSLALRVRLPWRSRLALCGVFALGGFVILFSVVRIIVTNTNNTRPELSWLALWSVIEASVACMVCNLAPFKVLFKGRMRTYQSDPYQHNNHQYVKEGKGVDSLELSSSGRSQQSSYPSHPALYPPTKNPQRRDDDSQSRSSFQHARRNARRGLQTHVSSDRIRRDHSSNIRNGAIVVTREVDRSEISADQATLPGEKSDDTMRTMWTNRESMESDQIILPPSAKLSGNYGRAY
jgi:hypothetical protein